ncbi:sugar-binding protein [Paenibacillus rhizoplanae]
MDEDRVNAWPYREDDGQYRVNYAGEQSFKFLSNSTPATSPGFESAAVTAGTDYMVENEDSVPHHHTGERDTDPVRCAGE